MSRRTSVVGERASSARRTPVRNSSCSLLKLNFMDFAPNPTRLALFSLE